MPDQGVTLNARIQYKKDTDANWTSNNPVLLENELIIVEMENGKCQFKIGDGAHPYVELPFTSLGFSGVLDIEYGGTGATTTKNARNALGVPAELGVLPADGLPFGYGVVVARGGLGDTIGQSTALDNYYWGVDDQSILWGGAQVNGATTPKWKRAMMMDSEQECPTLYSGTLSSGSANLTDGGKYAAIIICATLGQGEDLTYICIPGGNCTGQITSNEHWLSFSYSVSGVNSTITIRQNPSSGAIKYVWGLLKYQP